MRLLAAILLGLVCLSPTESGTSPDHGPSSEPGLRLVGRSQASLDASPPQSPLSPSRLDQIGEPALDEEESDDTDPLVSPALFAIGTLPSPAAAFAACPSQVPAFVPTERRSANLRC